MWCKHGKHTAPTLLFRRISQGANPSKASLQHGGCVGAYNMNPMNSPSAMPPIWQEARTADGRPYYYNVQTKVTQWTKPVELMNPMEVSMLFSTFDCCQSDMADFLVLYSVRWQINHGRNIPLKADGNTGIIRSQSKVHGKCQRFTKMLSHRLRRPKPLLHRKFYLNASVLL